MSVRICGAVFFILQTSLYLGVVSYAPALALEAGEYGLGGGGEMGSCSREGGEGLRKERGREGGRKVKGKDGREGVQEGGRTGEFEAVLFILWT